MPANTIRILRSASFLHVKHGLFACSTLFLTSGCEQNSNSAEIAGQERESRGTRPVQSGRSSYSPSNPSLSAAAFKQELAGLTITELQAAWSEIQGADLTSEQKKARGCQIIEQLTLSGGFNEARALVDDYGSGEMRDAMIFSLFSKAPEDLGKLLERIRGGSFSERDIHSVMSGLARNIAEPGGFLKVENLLNSGRPISQHEAEAIVYGLAVGIDLGNAGLQYYNDPDVPHEKLTNDTKLKFLEAEALLKQVCKANPHFTDKLWDHFLTNAGQASPFEGWESVLMNANTMSPSAKDKYLLLLGGHMFSLDPALAANTILQLGAKQDVSKILSEGVREWFRTDSEAAERWLSATNLKDKERDQIASGVAVFMVDEHRIEESWKWIGEIRDPTAKKQAEGKVWEMQRSIVRKEVARDPEATLQSLISGESKHSTYWIEEALSTWISKEPEKAEKWYQNNWDSLPPAKSQYVAAAYAREAIKTGDLVTASQWTSLIQDPKTKERIEASITKAEAGSAQGQ